MAKIVMRTKHTKKNTNQFKFFFFFFFFFNGGATKLVNGLYHPSDLYDVNFVKFKS